MSQSSPPRGRQTFPLALLFLVCTVAAVMAAVVRPLVDVDRWDDMFGGIVGIAIAFIGSVLCGCLIGVIVGLFQFHRSTGVICGAAIGALLGPIAALLLTANSSALQALIPTILIGSVVMLVVAWFTRSAARPAAEEVFAASEVVQQPAAPKSPAKNPFAD